MILNVIKILIAAAWESHMQQPPFFDGSFQGETAPKE